jgi:hypothetical protein
LSGSTSLLIVALSSAKRNSELFSASVQIQESSVQRGFRQQKKLLKPGKNIA